MIFAMAKSLFSNSIRVSPHWRYLLGAQSLPPALKMRISPHAANPNRTYEITSKMRISPQCVPLRVGASAGRYVKEL